MCGAGIFTASSARRAAASGFLEDHGRTRPPYQAMPDADVQQLAADFNRWRAEDLAEEEFNKAVAQ